MSVFSKLICLFSAIKIKISTSYFINFAKMNLKLVRRVKKIQEHQLNIKEKNKAGGLMLPKFSSVQLPSRVQFFVTPWTAAYQASLFITNSWSLLKLMSIESVMPSDHLILCHPFLLLPSIFPSIRVFSNELILRIRWPKY